MTAAAENPLLGATADRFQAKIASSDRKWYDLRNQAASPSKKSIARLGASLKNRETSAFR